MTAAHRATSSSASVRAKNHESVEIRSDPCQSGKPVPGTRDADTISSISFDGGPHRNEVIQCRDEPTGIGPLDLDDFFTDIRLQRLGCDICEPTPTSGELTGRLLGPVSQSVT